jgi:phasin family protein
MYPFPQSVNPALRTHFNAQVDFFNELSRSMAKSFQDVCQLNMQLGQTLLEESTLVGQRLMTTDRPNEALNEAVTRAQPTSDKLRAYQQHLSRIAASAQVDLSRVTEQHVQETSRTAHALAEEVSRFASEETARNVRKQEEALKSFRDPFKQESARSGKTAMQAPGNLQSADGKPGSAPFPGNAQGGSQAQPANGKNLGKPA